MGTSSRHGGPKGKNPLLPSDFDLDDKEKEKKSEIPKVNPQEKEEEKKRIQGWRNTKRNMTKYLNSNCSKEKVVSSHIRALGGAKIAAKNLVAAKIGTKNLINFISSVSSIGLKNVLENNNIVYENRDVDDVLGDIINIISPVPDTKENAVVREAMLNVLEEFYKNIDLSEIEKLNIFDKKTTPEIINHFISEIIFGRMMCDLGNSIEISKKTSTELIKLEKEIKTYIRETVTRTLKDKKNYDFSKNNNLVDKLYQDCYEVLGGIIND